MTKQRRPRYGSSDYGVLVSPSEAMKRAGFFRKQTQEAAACKPKADCVAALAEQYGQSEERVERVWQKIECTVAVIRNPAALLRSWCAREDWER